MIQRIQTLWLLIAAVATFLTLKFSFFSGTIADGSFQELNALKYIPILLLTATTGVLSAVTIFLYKNRKLQFRLNLAALVISLLTIYLYYRQTLDFTQGNYNLTAIFSLVVPVFLILSARGIYKDEKLIKSLDRLR